MVILCLSGLIKSGGVCVLESESEFFIAMIQRFNKIEDNIYIYHSVQKGDRAKQNNLRF